MDPDVSPAVVRPARAVAATGLVVFVVNDDAAVRQALASLVRSIGLTVRAFETAAEFRARQRPDPPNCLILDVRRPGTSGLDLQRELAEAGEQIFPIIFITGHGDIPTSVRAMKAVAVEFVTKPFQDERVLDATRQAFERGQIARQHAAEVGEIQTRYATLSRREREVLARIVRGRLNKQAAAELGLSVITIKIHRRKIMKKMRAGSLAELVLLVAKLA